ncbi:MAG: DNA-binding protein [Actinomycetia bacterium]|nr:DNA-binding protein [Actinomycetes bacterium]
MRGARLLDAGRGVASSLDHALFVIVEHQVAVEPLLLSIVDAARVFGVGRTKLYELIAAGDVDIVRIGRAVRVPLAALHEFVDGCRTSRVR